MLVGGQHLVGVEGGHPVQRLEELTQRVVAGLRMQRDVRGDARQHVVARQHQPVASPPRSTGDPASGRASTSPRDPSPATSGLSPSSISTSGWTASTSPRTGIAACCKRGDLVLGRTDPPQEAADPVEQVVGLLVAVVDQRGVGRVQRDPRPRRLTDAAGQPVVVGVDVGDEHTLHVAHLRSRRGRARRSSAANASSVFHPASTRYGPASVSKA